MVARAEHPLALLGKQGKLFLKDNPRCFKKWQVAHLVPFEEQLV